MQSSVSRWTDGATAIPLIAVPILSLGACSMGGDPGAEPGTGPGSTASTAPIRAPMSLEMVSS
jgi:hypothetical protein